MTCHAIQNKILALPDPRQLPESLRGHVAECAACRAVWEHAARLERLLEQLPAPPAPGNKKVALLDDLTTAGPVITRVPTVPTRDGFGFARPLLAFAHRNQRTLAALAAAVLVMLGGWWLFTGNGTRAVETVSSPKHPLLERIVQRDLALARADTPAKRLEVLGGLADDLSAETRSLARVASPDDLRDLARWFDKVVKDGVVKQAKNLPIHALNPAEKATLFDSLAGKLGAAGQEAEALAREAPSESQPALRKVAETARDGQKALRELARGGV